LSHARLGKFPHPFLVHPVDAYFLYPQIGRVRESCCFRMAMIASIETQITPGMSVSIKYRKKRRAGEVCLNYAQKCLLDG
jgi:hypothetical protein